ncbi:hypothetical protein FSARC_4253 [Fusarium sarcochroum]|uniref:BTB domain-containing protein n=1 Tax=Fusarium sarcochroum TaxID=1208366 RepID=A0A8H4U1Z9_9HYPO|nr:hypothetical protein FSARC_4253 [Fusarium sarcochroum]
MRVSPEDDPPEGSRDFKYKEEMYEVQEKFDEEGDRVPGGGGQTGRLQLREPPMWIIIFGSLIALQHQHVHAQVVIDRYPHFASSFSRGRFRAEDAPPSAQAAFIEFLYSGNFWLPDGTVAYPHRSVQADYELAVHMYSFSQLIGFPELESQAIQQILRLGKILTERETLAILALRIRPNFPNICTEGWLDVYLHERRHVYITQLQKEERARARQAQANQATGA